MEKNFLQDVVSPSKGRSIRNIPINTNRRRRVSSPDSEINLVRRAPRREVEEINTPPPPPRNPRKEVPYDLDSYKESSGFRKYFVIGSGIIGIIILVVILTTFSGAEVTIYPKQAEANINTSLNTRDKEVSSEVDTLTYQKISISEESFRTVEATGEEEVQQKSSGKITIYNDYTDKDQPLVKNTRFESPEGLIFRIDTSVVVPGKTDSGPGSIEVEVYADGVGEEYNIGPTDFTVPGFKGLPQYDSFTAKSNSGMNGGFIGTRSVVKESDVEDTLKILQEELKTTLKDKADAQIDQDHVLIYDLSSFVFEVLPRDDSGKEVKIKVKGTLVATVFSVTEFSKAVAEQSLKTFNPEDEVRIADISALTIESTSGEVDEIILNIDGNANFIWQTDTESLKQDLKGMTRKDLKTILQKYQGITRAEAVIKPFWKKEFPENVDKITIVEEK